MRIKLLVSIIREWLGLGRETERRVRGVLKMGNLAKI